MSHKRETSISHSSDVDPLESKTRVTTTRWTGRTGLKERRAYIVLVLISIFLSLAGFLAGLQQLHNNNHKFCQIIKAALVPVIPKPADPKQHPSRERAYESYQRVVKLGSDLGCIH